MVEKIPVGGPTSWEWGDYVPGAEGFGRVPKVGTKYMMPGWSSLNISTYTVYADYIFYIPIYVAKTMTFDRLAIHVTAGIADKSMRLGIYEWGDDDAPGALILDAGTVSVATTGKKELTIDQELEGGKWYYLALATEVGGNATLNVLPNAARVPITGSSGDTGVAPRARCPAKSGGAAAVGGGLPNPADAPTTQIYFERMTAVWLRAT